MVTFSSLTGCVTYHHFYVCVREDKSVFYTSRVDLNQHVWDAMEACQVFVSRPLLLSALSGPFGGFEEINYPQVGATLGQSCLDNRPRFPRFAAQPLVTMAGVCRDDEVVFSTNSGEEGATAVLRCQIQPLAARPHT